MKLTPQGDRFPRRPRAADVTGAAPAEQEFSLEKYVTPRDWELVEKILTWIASDADKDNTAQLLTWNKLTVVARWIQVVDTSRLSLITENEGIQKLSKQVLERNPNTLSESLGKQFFPRLMKQDLGAGAQRSFYHALDLALQAFGDPSSIAYKGTDQRLVAVAQMYPEKLADIQAQMDQLRVWDALLHLLKGAIACVPLSTSYMIFEETLRLGANIIILDPERQSQVQTLLAPVEDVILQEDKRRVMNLFKHRSAYNQGDEESVTRPHLSITANLGIIHAGSISLSKNGLIQLGKKQTLKPGAKLPDRLVA